MGADGSANGASCSELWRTHTGAVGWRGRPNLSGRRLSPGGSRRLGGGRVGTPPACAVRDCACATHRRRACVAACGLPPARHWLPLCRCGAAAGQRLEACVVGQGLSAWGRGRCLSVREGLQRPRPRCGLTPTAAVTTVVTVTFRATYTSNVHDPTRRRSAQPAFPGAARYSARTRWIPRAVKREDACRTALHPQSPAPCRVPNLDRRTTRPRLAQTPTPTATSAPDMRRPAGEDGWLLQATCCWRPMRHLGQ